MWSDRWPRINIACIRGIWWHTIQSRFDDSDRTINDCDRVWIVYVSDRTINDPIIMTTKRSNHDHDHGHPNAHAINDRDQIIGSYRMSHWRFWASRAEFAESDYDCSILAAAKQNGRVSLVCSDLKCCNTSVLPQNLIVSTAQCKEWCLFDNFFFTPLNLSNNSL